MGSLFIDSIGQDHGTSVWRVSSKNYASAEFIWGRLRLFQMPTIPIDESVVASKLDTTVKATTYHKARVLRTLKTQATIEHAVQDKQRMKAQVMLLLPG